MERRPRGRTGSARRAGSPAGSNVTGPMSTVARDHRVGRRGRARGRSSRRPPPVSTTSRLPSPRPSAVRDPGQAADAVAAHLGQAAVGVEERHGAVGAVGARAERDEPVGADAAVAVAAARRRVARTRPVRRSRRRRPGSRCRWRGACESGVMTTTSLPGVRGRSARDCRRCRTR